MAMDGLIKGLIDAALGGGGEEGGGGEDRAASPREERSRSSWAEVVSSGNHEETEQRSGSSRHPPGRNSRHEETEQRSGSSGHPPGRNSRHEETEQRSGSSRHPPGRNSRQEESEERTDGDWEVVGEKKHHAPPRRQHKVPMDGWNQYKRPPAEQEYFNHVGQGVDLEPSREELEDFTKACSRLWELDSNRLVPGKDYMIDCGEGKKVYQKGDMVSGNLFEWLSDDVLRKRTFARFCSLLDNYNPNQGSKEVVTSQEKCEQAAFIEEISRTAPIKYLHKYLTYKGIAPESNAEFKEMMEHLWFDLYGRGGGYSSSSAFEHVFVGEIKGRGEVEISGFHNWIQFYLEESKGRVDYQGYIYPRRRGQVPDSETQLLTLQFEWNGVLKSVSSTLIGVSPEFEIALYTLCFFMGGEDNHILLGPYPVNIKCYHLGRNKIGSVFPVAEN